MRERSACRCELQRDGVVGELNLLQLSVMSAPVIGGSLGLDVSSLYPDDHRLEVLAVEDVLRPSSSVPASSLSSESSERVSGVRAVHGERLGVNCEKALDVTLDGELAETIPGEIEVRAEALQNDHAVAAAAPG
jgi:diacylglycerol kinase family enzyme